MFVRSGARPRHVPITKFVPTAYANQASFAFPKLAPYWVITSVVLGAMVAAIYYIAVLARAIEYARAEFARRNRPAAVEVPAVLPAAVREEACRPDHHPRRRLIPRSK